MTIIKINKDKEGKEYIKDFKWCHECPFYTSYEYTEYGELTGFYDAICGITGSTIYVNECVYNPEVKDIRLDDCPISIEVEEEP